jgi:hypothetical protein
VSAFSDLVARFLDEFFVLQPDLATAVGDHRYDDRWPDTSEAGRAARLVFIDRWTAAFEGQEPSALAPAERVDRDLVLGELAAFRFGETELREETWDALGWVYLMGFSLHPLLAREFAPLAVRLASVAGRLEGIPRIVSDAREVLGSNPSRPVSKLHAEIAVQRVGGVTGLARQAVATAEAAAPEDAEVAALLPRLRAAADRAAEVLTAIGEHLADEVVPNAAGSPILGRELFAAKLRHTLRDPEAIPEVILARAEAEYAAVRAEMVRIAREIWPRWRPGEPAPGDEGALVRGTPTPSPRSTHGRGAVEFAAASWRTSRCSADLRQRARGRAVEIDWTPEFMRSFAGAMLTRPTARRRPEDVLRSPWCARSGRGRGRVLPAR